MTKTKNLTIAISICCSSALYADSVKLQEVSISETLEVGSNTHVNMDKVEKTQSKNLKDVLKDESSISVSNGGSQGTQRIYVRGIESTNLNVTLDGASQGANIFQHRGNVPSIDADLLKTVEVKTSGNAENGKGALGGSIAMITKDAQDLVEDGKNTGVILRIGHASGNDMNSGSITAYGVFDNYYGMYLNVSAHNLDNYKQGGDGNEVLGTASKNRDYFFKVSMLEKDDHTLRFGLGRNTRTGLVEDDKGAPATTAAEDAKDYTELTKDTFTAEHRYNPVNSLIDISTNIYKSSTQEENTHRDTSDVSKTVKNDIGGKIKNTFLTQIGNTHNRFVIGVDYSKEESKNETPGASNTTTQYVTVISKNLGVFTQNTTNIEKLAIHYGARLDKYDLDIGNIKSVDGSEFSPNFGLEYQLSNTLDIFANYSQAVRSTGTIPIGWMTKVDPTTTKWDNSLEPEKSKQKEFGFKYHDSNIFTSNDTVKFGVTYFNTKIEDLIEQDGGGSRGAAIQGLKNSEDIVKTKGYEVKTSWEKDAWYTSIAYTNAKTTQGGEVLSTQRRQTTATGDKLVWYTNYQVTPYLSLGYTLNAVDGIDYDNGTSMPGYTTHNLNAQWQSPDIKSMTLALAVNNLTDKKYEDQSSTYSDGRGLERFYEPGRDIRVSLKYKF